MSHAMTWQDRAVEATKGNGSRLGAILLAVLERWPRKVPAFADNAIITATGHVVCDFKDRDGNCHHGVLICDTEELTTNFRGLADHLKLDDAERTELFAKLQKWLAHDFRAISARRQLT